MQSLDDAEVMSNASSDRLLSSDSAAVSCQPPQRNTYALSAHISESGQFGY